MKKAFSVFIAFSSIFFITLIFSCTPSVFIDVDESLKADVKIQNICSQELNSIAKSFGVVDENKSMIDETSVKSELEKNGLSGVSIKVENFADFTASMKCNSIANVDEKFGNTIQFEKKNGKTQLRFELTSKMLLDFVQSTEGLNEIMELLMAPIYTQEQISPEEYLEVLSSFYGKQSSEKFASSDLKIKISVPEKIASTSILENKISEYPLRAKISSEGKTALITIPIYRYLSIPTETTFVVQF